MNPVAIYLVIGALAGAVAGSWHPLAMFHKAPPTAQLTELQAKLTAQQEKAKKDAEAAEAAKVSERAKLEAQIRAAQQDALGAQTALKKVPPAHRTPEVNLADRMATRVSLKLATAIGKLPDDEQQAMIELVEQALSDKQAEVDEANRKLAARDADFKAVSGEREQLKAQIPILTKQAQEAAQKAQETQAAVTAKTNEVKTWADKANTALAENGSLWSSIKRGVFALVGVYVFLAFVLPAIVKALAQGNPLKPVLRNISGYLLNPVLHHDASVKLDSLTKPPTQ